MAQKEKLTESDENLIKDILKVIGQDSTLNRQFASAVGLKTKGFNDATDAIYTKLGNGRVIFED
jgi:hypothetical protein